MTSTPSLIEAPRVLPGTLQQHCANHRDRAASALCVECRKSICQECATQWDGINYCVDCISRRREKARQARSLFSWGVTLVAIVMFFFLAIEAMLWVGGFLTGFS